MILNDDFTKGNIEGKEEIIITLSDCEEINGFSLVYSKLKQDYILIYDCKNSNVDWHISYTSIKSISFDNSANSTNESTEKNFISDSIFYFNNIPYNNNYSSSEFSQISNTNNLVSSSLNSDSDLNSDSSTILYYSNIPSSFPFNNSFTSVPSYSSLSSWPYSTILSNSTIISSTHISYSSLSSWPYSTILSNNTIISSTHISYSSLSSLYSTILTNITDISSTIISYNSSSNYNPYISNAISDFSNIYESSLYNESDSYFLLSDSTTYNIDKINQTDITNNIYFSDNFDYGNKIIKNETKQKKEEIVQDLNEIMNSIEIGKIYEINGEDFTVLIKPTNSSYLESTTHINFIQCEEKLRKKLNISNSRILTFLQ